LITAEFIHLIEEGGVLQRDSKRLPTRLRDTAVKGSRIAKLRPPLRQLFPESPTTAIEFGQLRGCARHRTEAGGIGHGSVLHEDKVAVIHHNDLAFAVP
jgi:hypothetical protein